MNESSGGSEETQRAESYQTAVRSTITSHRLIANMLSMVHAAVQARSVAINPLDASGAANGPSVVLRTGQLGVSPQELRREYLGRYQASDPLHPRLFAETRKSLVGTRDIGGTRQLERTPFGEFAHAAGMPVFVRVLFRLDGLLVGALFVGRTAWEGEFSDREVAFLSRAQAFLEQAYCLAIRRQPEIGGEQVLRQAGLTLREAEVARHAASGMRSREIADLLIVSETTVKTHLARIYNKLDVRTRTELAARLRPNAA